MGAIRAMLTAAALAFGLGAAVAEAGDRLVVVELYTSQGCSSCPPADELLARLAERDGVLPLALHVDYWDYIGWKDTFASPAFTRRQKAYAYAMGSKTVYTPQMVIGGRDHLIGTREMELAELIMSESSREPEAVLTLRRNGGGVSIRAEARRQLSAPVVVQLVRFNPRSVVEIRRGENAGRTLTYTNIVTEWREIGRWSGAAPLELEAPVEGALPAAVILQAEGPGPILAAAVLR